MSIWGAFGEIEKTSQEEYILGIKQILGAMHGFVVVGLTSITLDM